MLVDLKINGVYDHMQNAFRREMVLRKAFVMDKDTMMRYDAVWLWVVFLWNFKPVMPR